MTEDKQAGQEAYPTTPAARPPALPDAERLTINRTPNLACPGCIEGRLHSEEEFEAFHPYARHGFWKGQGWSHPDLEPTK
jgi:hypothetical protein